MSLIVWSTGCWRGIKHQAALAPYARTPMSAKQYTRSFSTARIIRPSSQCSWTDFARAVSWDVYDLVQLPPSHPPFPRSNARPVTLALLCGADPFSVKGYPMWKRLVCSWRYTAHLSKSLRGRIHYPGPVLRIGTGGQLVRLRHLHEDGGAATAVRAALCSFRVRGGKHWAAAEGRCAMCKGVERLVWRVGAVLESRSVHFACCILITSAVHG